MKKCGPKEFSQILKKQSISSRLIFLIGNEPVLMDKILSLMKERLTGECVDFNWDVIDKETFLTFHFLRERLYSAPFGSGYRVVIVKDAFDFWSINQREKEKISELIEKIPPYSILCFVQLADAIEHPFISFVEEKALIVSFIANKDDKMKNWVKNQMKKRGYEADDELALLFIERFGPNYTLLEHEIEKFCLSESLELPEKPPTIGEFIKAIYSRDPKLLTLVYPLFQEFGFPYLLRILCSSVEKILAVKKATKEGIPLEEAVTQFSRNHEEAQLLEDSMSNYSYKETFKILNRLLKAEIMLKSGILKPELILQDLVLLIVR